MKDPKKTAKHMVSSAYGAEGSITQKPYVRTKRKAAKKRGSIVSDPQKPKMFDIGDYPMFKNALDEYKNRCRTGGNDLQIGVVDMRIDGGSDAAAARCLAARRSQDNVWDDDVERIYQEWATRHPKFVEEAVSEHMTALDAGPMGESDFRFTIADATIPDKLSAQYSAEEFAPEKQLRTEIRAAATKATKARKCHRGVNLRRKTQAIICDPLSNTMSARTLLSRDRFLIVIVALFDDFENEDNISIDTKLVASFKLNTETVDGFRYTERSHELNCIDIYHELCPKQCRCDNVFEATYDKEFEKILYTYCTALGEVPEYVEDSDAEAGFLFIDFENITMSSVAKMISDGYIDAVFTDDDIEYYDKPYIVFSDTSRVRHYTGSKVKAKYLMSLTEGLKFVVDQAGKDAVYVKIATELYEDRSDLYIFNSRASAEAIIKAGKEIDAERKERFRLTAEDEFDIDFPTEDC